MSVQLILYITISVFLTGCVSSSKRYLASTQNVILKIEREHQYHPNSTNNNLDDLSDYHFALNLATAYGKGDLIGKQLNDYIKIFNIFRSYKKEIKMADEAGQISQELITEIKSKIYDNELKEYVYSVFEQLRSKKSYYTKTKKYKSLLDYLIDKTTPDYNKILAKITSSIIEELFYNKLDKIYEREDFSLNYPIIINGKIYKARAAYNYSDQVKLSETNRYTEMGHEEGNEKNYFYFEVDGLSIDELSDKTVKFLEHPILFYRYIFGNQYETFDKLANNPKEAPKKVKCFKGDGHKVTPFNLHGYISQKNFELCEHSEENGFKDYAFEVALNLKSYDKLYPEYDKLFDKNKKEVKITILNSHSDGFGHSNFVNLMYRYKHTNFETGRGDRQKKSPGDFKLKLEKGKSGDKYRYVEYTYKHPNTEQILNLKFIYVYDLMPDEEQSVNDYTQVQEQFTKYMWDSDFVVYQGHSGFGDKVDSFNKINFMDKYQSFFMLACGSLNYGMYPIYSAKVNSSPNENGKNWDLVGSNNDAPLIRSEETLEAYIDFYVKAWEIYGNNGSLADYNYQALIDSLNRTDNHYSVWSVANTYDNQYQPNY